MSLGVQTLVACTAAPFRPHGGEQVQERRGKREGIHCNSYTGGIQNTIAEMKMKTICLRPLLSLIPGSAGSGSGGDGAHLALYQD